MADPRHPRPVDPLDPVADTGRVRVDRTGPGRYAAGNGRAAAIPIGLAGSADAYSPTELLRIALAGCVGLSADHVVSRRLGGQSEVSIAVTGDHDPVERRFTRLASTMTLDLSGLDPQAQEQLRAVVTRAVHRYCTVGRTLEHATPVSLAVVGSA
jgi:uncharacterized OsmC-like protein